MDTRKIDLHVHSTASDGTMSPAELAVAVKEAGLCAFALTDHDTVDGIAEARTAAKAASVELIPGVELSCDYKGKEVHMVGLYLDETNPRLLTHLARFRDNRDNRNQKMYQKLNEEGFAISEEGLREMFPDAVLTRAHVARFLLEHGYIKSISEAFEKYIGDGCRCHVPREKITPQEGIELIHHANGKAVLAHPVLYHMSDDRLRELITNCLACGLDGIEALWVGRINWLNADTTLRLLTSSFNAPISIISANFSKEKPVVSRSNTTTSLRLLKTGCSSARVFN